MLNSHQLFVSKSHQISKKFKFKINSTFSINFSVEHSEIQQQTTEEENNTPDNSINPIPLELEDALSQSRGRTRRGRSPKVESDDEDFIPSANSTQIMSRPASRGPATRTRSKSRTASTKPAKRNQRSKSRKSTRSRQRAASKKSTASRSRSRSASTGRKPAARGRGRK